MSDLVYLDHAAATPVRPEILAEHTRLCQEFVANPHGTTRQSEACRRAVAASERRVLACLGIDWREARVVWTSGGTEADNLACLGVFRTGVRACLVDAGAHSAMLEPCRERGDCREIPLDSDGRLELSAVTWPDKGLVAACHVNNETGAAADLLALRRSMDAAKSEALLAVDVVQSLGKVAIPWREARLDLVALSARKIGGPCGVGALVVRRGVSLSPLLFGGGQQDGIRPGTVDVVGVQEFALAAELAVAEQEAWNVSCHGLREHALHVLCEVAGESMQVLSPSAGVPQILAVSLPGYEGAVLMRLLAETDVVVGAGSACHAESAETSHVLTAMGAPEPVARGQLRISFGRETCRTDIDRLAAALAEVLRNY